jgi:hypothetical protein
MIDTQILDIVQKAINYLDRRIDSKHGQSGDEEYEACGMCKNLIQEELRTLRIAWSSCDP